MASLPQSPFFCTLKSINTHNHTNTNSTTLTFKVFSSSSPNNPPDNSSSEPDPVKPDPVKLAFERAKAYKKSIKSNPNQQVIQNSVSKSAEKQKSKDGSGPAGGIANKEVPLAVRLAMDKAKDYAKNKGLKGEKENLGNTFVEKTISKKDNSPKISSMDFVGLNFADKKEGRGLPPGLVPISDPYLDGDLPDVEIIVGDSSKFDKTTLKPKTDTKENSDLYKPKVSTWGVFPRPSNISEAYGGGKTIRPGEVLETAEDKAAKEARTRELLVAYKSKYGLNIDPKLKSECEKLLKDGDSLMDRGKLKEALPFYEKVMDKLAFKTELHGSAALQWSICQDSLSRSNEAKVMYEKLQSHPTVHVSKKAREFMFSFRAMEMMKVKSLALSRATTGYQNYFDAFVKDKDKYPTIIQEPQVKVDEQGALGEAIQYILFLFSPLFIVLLIAVQKGNS